MAKDRGRIVRDEERGETHYVTSEGMSGCEECGATLDLYTGQCVMDHNKLGRKPELDQKADDLMAERLEDGWH